MVVIMDNQKEQVNDVFQYLIIYLILTLSLIPFYQLHCNSWLEKDGGNQDINLFKGLYCKWLTNSKQLPAFRLDGDLGLKLQCWDGDSVCFHCCAVILSI